MRCKMCHIRASNRGRAILFAVSQAFRSDADLDYARFIDTCDPDIFKHAIINFALARPLDDDFPAATYQRPKFRRLWLLDRIGGESEVDSSVRQISMT